MLINKTLFLTAVLLCFSLSGEDKIDFNTQIRPILSSKCFNCHGPDKKARKGGSKKKGGLRLDNGQGAFVDDIIVPGHPEKSSLIALIKTDDEDDVMPPEGKGDRLKDKDIKLLEEWIRQGAQYDRHWSYAKLKDIKPPAVNNKWVKNDIDRFILSRLQKENLKPSAEADRYTLIRRLSFDLTGLPPSISETEDFVNDKSPQAYEKLVEILMAKPAFGERWASIWLDLARYADSQGYTSDNFREIWAYRDWVIKAINSNMPYDQFSIEQLAGDMLPKPTNSQLVATAFNRNTLTNTEGGTIDEEFRVLAVKDRVNTVMQVWMGTTATCSQCHDHRYDPISQEDYYKMYSVFNNSADSDKGNDAPRIKVIDPAVNEDITALEKQMSALKPRLTAAEHAWVEKLKKSQAAPSPVLFKSKVLNKKSKSVNIDVPITGKKKLYLTVTDGGNGNSHDWANWIDPVLVGPKGKMLLTKLKWKKAQAGYGKVRKNINASNKPIMLNGKKRQGIGTHANSVIEYDLPKGYTRFQVTAAIDDGAVNGSIAFVVSNTADINASPLGAVLPIVKIPADKRSAKQKSALTEYFLTNVSPEYKKLNDRLTALKSGKGQPSVPIMQEMKPRKAHLHLRGNYLAKGQEVGPGVPEEIFPFGSKYPLNRLGFSKWLMDDNNPMTSRVTANRFWEQIFGTGIVGTSEEFGSQGELPSHPLLLDWMANYLRNNKWDTKRLLKLIVTSATYRQSSKVIGDIERDPKNRLLARGPRVRLTAEMVRDQGLFVSGLLSKKMYGPPVRPIQPKFGLRAAFGGSTDWKDSTGEDKYRRAIYTTWRRIMPYPSMTTFDSPSRENCSVRRISTNTPLQALVVLNDPVYWEFSQAFAKRIMETKKSLADRLGFGFRMSLTRPPSAKELSTMNSQFESIQKYLAKNPKSAKEISSQFKPANVSDIDFASWVLTANALINLDEAIMKR